MPNRAEPGAAGRGFRNPDVKNPLMDLFVHNVLMM